MCRVVGEIRDFNGGMILKQQELLDRLKLSLGKSSEQHNILLEQFFYSLMPMEMRSVLETDPLKQLFLMLLQTIKIDSKRRRKAGDWLCKQEPSRLFAVFPDCKQELVASFNKKVESLSLPNHRLVSFSLDFQETSYCGYLLFGDDRELQDKFLKILEETF